MKRRNKLDPHNAKDKRPDVLEKLARLLPGSTYRVPAQGGGGGGMTSADVAGALGMMTDRMAKTVIIQVAVRGGNKGAVLISRASYAHILRAVKRARPPPIDLKQPGNAFRLRLAIRNAGLELIHPERMRSFAVMAKEAKMRRTTYADLHKLCTARLQELMNNGRREFSYRLRSQGHHDQE